VTIDELVAIAERIGLRGGIGSVQHQGSWS